MIAKCQSTLAIG